MRGTKLSISKPIIWGMKTNLESKTQANAKPLSHDTPPGPHPNPTYKAGAETDQQQVFFFYSICKEQLENKMLVQS